MKSCTLCPRKCGADRYKGKGFCGCGSMVRAAKAYLHMWEEPCISGTNGSGTVFFSGCCLKCRFCQNYEISQGGFGKDISVERLSEIFLELQSKGAHNINLVSPTPYVPQIIAALDLCGDRLTVPIVYNTGGYERVETLHMLNGYVDIYLPDLKYYDSELSEKFSGAKDYFEAASAAVKEMYRQTGDFVIEDGIMRRGVIIRCLVLPGHRQDSIKLLEWIADNFPRGGVLVSLMSQYTPYRADSEYKELSRRVSTFEYNCVTQRAAELGLRGFMQERSSAKEEYTPDFDLYGI